MSIGHPDLSILNWHLFVTYGQNQTICHLYSVKLDKLSEIIPQLTSLNFIDVEA